VLGQRPLQDFAGGSAGPRIGQQLGLKKRDLGIVRMFSGEAVQIRQGFFPPSQPVLGLGDMQAQFQR